MKNDITQAIKTAMKARDKVALKRAAGFERRDQNLEIDAGKPLEDGEVLGVIRTQVKQLNETIEGFNAAGRSEDADEGAPRSRCSAHFCRSRCPRRPSARWSPRRSLRLGPHP